MRIYTKSVIRERGRFTLIGKVNMIRTYNMYDYVIKKTKEGKKRKTVKMVENYYRHLFI